MPLQLCNISDCEKKIILIDLSRNPQQYLDYAKENEAEIMGVIETHPHADFINSHLKLHQTLGSTIYASKIVKALYPHQTFDDGEQIQLGKITLSAINTQVIHRIAFLFCWNMMANKKQFLQEILCSSAIAADRI